MSPIRPTSETMADVYVPEGQDGGAKPVVLLRPADLESGASHPDGIDAKAVAWLKAAGFKGKRRQQALIPGADGTLAAAALGLGAASKAGIYDPDGALVGLLPKFLPEGDWRLAGAVDNPDLAALAWGLGAYRFRAYKSGAATALPRLVIPAGVDRSSVLARADAVALGRDVINTPANDMGPEELEAAARRLATHHGAEVSSVIGDDLLKQNFPLIHAVGRASPRAPRVVDLRWGRADAPKVTLVGKGIVFDTGGLDLKPPSAMLLMKKDMGGAAAALTLAHMIMAAKLDVRLRVILAIAENAVAGDAFRPGDIIRSRSGKTVEIGNTDAEGRLVLADALSLADEEAPDHLFTFATLTGAARVALGPDMVPFYSTDPGLTDALMTSGNTTADFLWPMPLDTPYATWLDSPSADMNNISEGGFAGSIVAAIFLRKFVQNGKKFAHFDLYGWRPQAKPLGPKGGEPHAARAVYDMLSRQYRPKSA
ncbi:MAG: leucyl aminopeptidase family protein [Hyphomicrobiaceae bacterium]